MSIPSKIVIRVSLKTLRPVRYFQCQAIPYQTTMTEIKSLYLIKISGTPKFLETPVHFSTSLFAAIFRVSCQEEERNRGTNKKHTRE